MALKVLGIAGSPRKDGNTDTLLHEVLRGAAEAGAEVEFLALRRQKISPCVECDRCRALGRCAVQDGFTDIREKMIAADHIVFASPIFFVAVSAQAKLLIDRCQCLWSLKHVLRAPLFDPPRPGRRGLFISCCGSDRRWMFDGARRTLKAFFNVLEVEYAGELLHTSIDRKGDIAQHPAALAEAHRAGLALVRGEKLPMRVARGSRTGQDGQDGHARNTGGGHLEWPMARRVGSP